MTRVTITFCEGADGIDARVAVARTENATANEQALADTLAACADEWLRRLQEQREKEGGKCQGKR